MISGFFIENTPFIQVAIAGKIHAVVPFFVLDTGFTGDLKVTPQIASDIGLNINTVMYAQIADGSTLEIPVSYAQASMEGSIKNVDVLVSQSMPLAGINFFRKFGYTVTLDCSQETVRLERLSDI